MTRRIALFAVALLMALAGTGLVFSYANGRTAPAAAEEQVAVLVATEVIPAGTTGQEALAKDLVSLTEMPARLAPSGALVDIQPVADQEAATDLQPGEVLMPARFLSSVLNGSMEIPDDKVAITVEVQDPQRVASFVRPGSEVAVFATYAAEHVTAPPPDTGRAVVEHATKLMLPRATVIAIGPTAQRVIGTARAVSQPQDDAPAGPEAQVPVALVTFGVPIEDAQKLAHTSALALEGAATLTLALLNADSRTNDLPSNDNHTLFGWTGR